VIREETAGPATLVHDCDMALYRAKGAGRNRVSVAIAA
jgi:PleD family two-component response regulator